MLNTLKCDDKQSSFENSKQYFVIAVVTFAISFQGNYFASHFFMGGEKFDTPHPEGYLFGENMDLNFLGNRPVQVRKEAQLFEVCPVRIIF